MPTKPCAILAVFLLAACSAVPSPRDECGDAKRLRQAAERLYSEEAIGYRAKDVERFVPCADPDAVYLTTADGQTHTCRQVREHTRERFGRIVSPSFTFRIVEASVSAADTGQGRVDYEFFFSNRVAAADGSIRLVEIAGEHADTWTCIGGTWRLSSMTEVKPQKVKVDGTLREQ